MIVSTEGSQQRIEELESIGAFGCVREPFHPEQLRDVLKPLLGMKDDELDENREEDGDVYSRAKPSWPAAIGR